MIEEWLGRALASLDAGERHRYGCLKKAVQKNTQGVLSGDADQPDARSDRHRAVADIARNAPSWWWIMCCNPALSKARSRSAPTAWSIPPQHRRTGPCSRRDPRLKLISTTIITAAADRSVAVAVQCLRFAEGAGDFAGACRAADANAGAVATASPDTKKLAG